MKEVKRADFRGNRVNSFHIITTGCYVRPKRSFSTVTEYIDGKEKVIP